MNLPVRVEESSIFLESNNFPCSRLHRGTKGNFFIPSGFLYWCSWSGYARAALTWPVIRQVPLPYGNQMEAGVGVLDGIAECRRHNLLSSSSSAPLLLLKTKSQFQRYSFSLLPRYFFFLICNCNFVCSKSSVWLS